MKRWLLALSAVAVAVPSTWIAFLWLTSGRGHPFCREDMSFPTKDEIVRDAVRQNLERRVRALKVINPNTGKPTDVDPGPYGESPARPETVSAFLRAFPDCCKLQPIGVYQNKLDKTINLLHNYEDIEVNVIDPTWRSPYSLVGDSYTVNSCVLAKGKRK